jgi:hypothetical protein
VDSRGLVDVLLVDRGLNFEILEIREVDILGDGCGDRAGSGVDVSRDLEVVA